VTEKAFLQIKIQRQIPVSVTRTNEHCHSHATEEFVLESTAMEWNIHFSDKPVQMCNATHCMKQMEVNPYLSPETEPLQ
jgi:hypothetical protein